MYAHAWSAVAVLSIDAILVNYTVSGKRAYGLLYITLTNLSIF